MKPLKIKHDEAITTENEAIAAGIAILKYYTPSGGESDFDKGMKILQDAVRKRENAKDKAE